LFEHDLFEKPVPTFPDHALRRIAFELRRQPAAITFGENGTDQPSKAFGLLVMQIAGQAE
jgi:hypothetical protein